MENVRETVNFISDRRRTITELSKEYPRVDFSHCNDDGDMRWNAYRSRVSDESKAMETEMEGHFQGFQNTLNNKTNMFTGTGNKLGGHLQVWKHPYDYRDTTPRTFACY